MKYLIACLILLCSASLANAQAWVSGYVPVISIDSNSKLLSTGGTANGFSSSANRKGVIYFDYYMTGLPGPVATTSADPDSTSWWYQNFSDWVSFASWEDTWMPPLADWDYCTVEYQIVTTGRFGETVLFDEFAPNASEIDPFYH